MKIAYLADAPLPSQAANAVQVLHMAAAMATLGHEVELLAPWHAGRARGRAETEAMRRRFALRGRFRLRYLPYVSIGGRLRGSYFVVAAAAARAAHADLVFTRNPRIARLACGIGLDVVLESHLIADPELARDLAASPRLKRWVFISERLRDLHGDAAITAGARCLVAHDGVDLARFTPVLPPRAARDLLGIGVAGQLVVHSGHLYAGRGAELLLDVARALPDVQIAFVGGADADVRRMREHAVGLANVRFAGHRPLGELPAWLFAADVLVMAHTTKLLISDGRTTTSEYASPMKLFEYMAAGRAIVATRFPSVEEVLHDGDNAILVEPDRLGPLCDAIASLLADPARAQRLGAKARQDVEPYGWEARAARILAGLTLRSG